MSDYREELNTLQLVALDIMFRAGEGSTEALVSAKEILNSGGVKEPICEQQEECAPKRLNYMVFHTKFEEKLVSVSQFAYKDDMLKTFPSPEIQREVLINGYYQDGFQNYVLIEIRV